MSRDHDFEAQVRLALGEHAGDAPRVDLADAALSRARSMRRRRTAISAAAALVTVAVAVPVATQIVRDDGASDHTTSRPTDDNGAIVLPTQVQVAIARLQPGDEPNVSYIDGSTFVDSTGVEHDAEPVPGEIVTDAAELDDGALVFQRDKATAVTTYTTDGGSTDLPDATSVTPPAIDQGTKAAVFAVHEADAAGQPADGDTIVYANALTGNSTTVDTGMHVRQVMGAYNGRVVFNATDKKDDVVGVVVMAADGSAVSTPWDNLKTVTAVSPDESLLAAIRSRGYLPGQQHCAVMVEAADASVPLWTNCEWNPVEFSPDGSRVIALSASTEGLGPNNLAVMDSRTGEVVAQYATRGVFGRATFDGTAGSIVAVVADGRQASIVRCTIDGQCDLATPPAPVTPDEPDAVLHPYQLTAN
jgi:hypothetical protein